MCASGYWKGRFPRGDERPEYGEQKTRGGEERFNEEKAFDAVRLRFDGSL